LNFFEILFNGISDELLLIIQIGFILIIASILAFLLRLFRQPLIPSYVIAGIIIGPLVLGLIQNQGLIDSLSQIGIAFLIFTAGLEIKFSKLKEVGSVATIGGILQIVLLFFIGFFVSIYLGIKGIAPFYVGLVVAFSSTMIVVKLLCDKHEINTLHGRIIIGILLLQDIAAIIALTVLNDFSLIGIMFSFLKAIIFAVLALVLSKFINPVLKNAARTPELLIIISISFLFLFIIGASLASLSIIIGSFFAGVALANSDYKTEIQGKIYPIRDFFAVIFFVALGMQLKLISSKSLIFLLILLLLVMVIKPIITMLLIRLFGYKRITAFLTGNSLAQTSEFSFILVTIGYSLNHISEELFSVLILVTILTMSFTNYFIKYDKKLARWLDFPLNILNKLKTRKENLEYLINDDKKIILFGCHRMGSLILKELKEHDKEVLVIDYNPDIIKSLIKNKISCIYGDFVNEEVLQKVNLKKAEIVLSTVPNLDDNLFFIKKAVKLNPKLILFITAERISEAIKLYQAGADYVILPQVLGGKETFEVLNKIGKDKKSLRKIKKEHLEYLDSIHHILY
jgi:Kef-type K+ transport system membrane component KefB